MKNQKGFIQIIIILVVLVLIGGAYYFGTKNKQNVVSEVPTATLIASAKPSQTPVIFNRNAPITNEPIINWIIYTNEGLNISLKYPRTTIASGKEQVGVIEDVVGLVDGVMIGPPQTEPLIVVKRIKGVDSSLNEWWPKNFTGPICRPGESITEDKFIVENMTVDGHVAIRLTEKDDCGLNNVLVKYSNSIYHLEMPNQILSTFKFLK